MLEEGNIEQLADALRSIDSSSPELAERIRIEAGYFDNNAKRMRYPEFRRQHLFVGSGVIEAGCKTVIGAYCKQSGLRHARKRVLDRSWRQRNHRSSPLPTQP